MRQRCANSAKTTSLIAEDYIQKFKWKMKVNLPTHTQSTPAKLALNIIHHTSHIRFNKHEQYSNSHSFRTLQKWYEIFAQNLAVEKCTTFHLNIQFDSIIEWRHSKYSNFKKVFYPYFIKVKFRHLLFQFANVCTFLCIKLIISYIFNAHGCHHHHHTYKLKLCSLLIIIEWIERSLQFNYSPKYCCCIDF